MPFGVGFTVVHSTAPPPTLTSIANVGTNGGTALASGTGFQATPTVVADIDGTPTSLEVTFDSSSRLQLTLAPGTYLPGRWNIIVTNPNGLFVVGEEVFVISAVIDLATIYGAELIGEWIAGNAVRSGSDVVSVPDSSGGGNPLSIVSATAPTYLGADARFGQSPATISHNGNSYLACPALDLGSGGSLYLLGALFIVTVGTAQGIAEYNTALLPILVQAEVDGQWDIQAYSELTEAQIANPLTTTPGSMVAGSNNLGSGNSQVTVSINNGTESDGASAPYTAASGAQLTFGSLQGGVSPSTLVWCVLAAVTTKPTPTQQAATVAYFNSTYGVTSGPGLVDTTVVPSNVANAPLRIIGSNYLTGVTAQLVVDGSPVSLDIVSQTTTEIDSEVPAGIPDGTYTLVITNTDGNSTTFPGAVTALATSESFAAAVFEIMGLSTVGIFAEDATLSGSGVSQWQNQAQPGAAASQADAVSSLPAWTASDARFNDQPSITPNGTTDMLLASGMGLASTTPALYTIDVCYFGAASGSTECLSHYDQNGLDILLAMDFGIEPRNYYDGTQIYWGQGLSGTHAIYTGIAAGANPELTIAVDGESPQSIASSRFAIQSGAPMYLFSLAGGSLFYAQPIACRLIFNTVPTSTQIAQIQTILQARYGVPAGTP